MSQDIQSIRQQLKSCEEVESPYDIKIGKHVKYITLENESEFFYEGGIYVKMGDNKIVLKNGSKYIYVPLIFKNASGRFEKAIESFLISQGLHSCSRSINS